MYACAELFCVLTNFSNKFVFKRFPLRGALTPSAPLRAPLVIAYVDRGHRGHLVGDTGCVSPNFFRWRGYNMSFTPAFFSLGFVFGEVSKIKVMLVMFCVKSFSC